MADLTDEAALTDAALLGAPEAGLGAAGAAVGITFREGSTLGFSTGAGAPPVDLSRLAAACEVEDAAVPEVFSAVGLLRRGLLALKIFCTSLFGVGRAFPESNSENWVSRFSLEAAR